VCVCVCCVSMGFCGCVSMGFCGCVCVCVCVDYVHTFFKNVSCGFHTECTNIPVP